MRPDWEQLRHAILDASATDIGVASSTRTVGGGDINDSYRVESSGRQYFLKLNGPSALPMFEAEADGLRAMSAVEGCRVPGVIASGTTESQSFLLLEWLELQSGGATEEERLGRGLAMLHRTASGRFGWPHDNFIGTTAQINRHSEDWQTFYRDQRLAPQLALATANGFGGRIQDLGDRLMTALPDILAGHEPAVSLTHGDLWGGNRAWLADGTPVLFDPAVCFADRETDLAMTRLFGGFGARFYDAYNESWPLPAGHERRVGLYQLYHLLNHLNLFGSGYLGRSTGVMEKLLHE